MPKFSDKFKNLIRTDVPRQPFLHPAILSESYRIQPAFCVDPHHPAPPFGFIASYCSGPEGEDLAIPKEIPVPIDLPPPPDLELYTDCPIISGPVSGDLFENFRFAYTYEGSPLFQTHFSIDCQNQIQVYCTHIYSLEYSPDQPRNIFDLRGAIHIAYPGQEAKAYHLFTGQYSITAHTGIMRLFAAPVELSALCKPCEGHAR